MAQQKNDIIPTKWKWIAMRLESLGAPPDIVQYARNIDAMLFVLGLGENTLGWEADYESMDKRSLFNVVTEPSYCPACMDAVDIGEDDIECIVCLYCKLGNETGCTPSEKYGFDWYGAICRWIR